MLWIDLVNNLDLIFSTLLALSFLGWISELAIAEFSDKPYYTIT